MLTNAAMEKTPFFIVGCVRSGTTLLRNILDSHPRLACPAETHFFRWGDPYGMNRFREYYYSIPNDLSGKKPIYSLHRKVDKCSDEEFDHLLETCRMRGELQLAYSTTYIKRVGKPDARWFDKSPQNIYGILLLRAAFPKAQFLHIVRNPFDVIASLIFGEVIRADSLVGACNYWLEAVQIFNEAKNAFPSQCLEIKFERLIKAPVQVVKDTLRFLGEDPRLIAYDYTSIHKRCRHCREVLTNYDVQLIVDICGEFMLHYGYDYRRV